MCSTNNESSCVLSRKLPSDGMDFQTRAHFCSEECQQPGLPLTVVFLHGGRTVNDVCVCVCVYPFLYAVCPAGNLPGPRSRHPSVPGSHGDMASGCHNNLQASSERSCGTNDRLETVIGLQHKHPTALHSRSHQTGIKSHGLSDI